MNSSQAPFAISEDQIAAIRKEGFVLLPNVLTPRQLIEWQKKLSELNEFAVGACNTQAQPTNMGFAESHGQTLLTRVNDLFAYYPDAVLDLMASPAILNIARGFGGEDIVPLQCDALFKQFYEHSEVLWHQDAIHSRNFPYFNIGIYLDDASAEDGCLELVPGSHHDVQDIRNLNNDFGWDIPGKIKVPAKAGDVIVHDMMVLHASGVKRNEKVRRTIYMEMRPAIAILDQGFQSKKWMELRRRWMAMVLRKSGMNFHNPSYIELIKDLANDADEFEQILAHREPPVPALY